MKKGTRTALIVACVMIIVGATLMNIARGRGEDLGSFFNSGLSFSSTGGTLGFGGQAGYTVCLSGEERFDPAEVRSLDLDWVSGAVLVEHWAGEEILMREETASTLSEGQRLRYKLSGGTLSVLFCADGQMRVPDKALIVLLPEGFSLKALDADAISAAVTLQGLSVEGELDADTTSGEVRVKNCACVSLDVDTTSGAVTVEETAVAGAIDADSSSGAITVSACACASLDADATSGRVSVEKTAIAGTVEADTTSGEVVLRDLSEGCRADVNTSSGKVELQFIGAPKTVEVETSSGDVRLSFPKGTVIDLDYDTASGRLSGSLNSAKGGLPVTVGTVSGDLTVDEGR